MDGIGVKEEAGNNLGCVPSPYVLDNSGDQISQIPVSNLISCYEVRAESDQMADSAQKKKNLQREAQRKAQRRCRDRQRRTRDEERQQHAKIREELKQEQRKIEMQNRELLQLREQERQLISRVEKSEEHNKVLRSSNEALQRSLDLLCQNTHGVDPRLNRQPRIGSVAPSPTGSQSGHEDLMSLRNLRCFPYLPGKESKSSECVRATLTGQETPGSNCRP